MKKHINKNLQSLISKLTIYEKQLQIIKSIFKVKKTRIMIIVYRERHI